MPEQTLKEKTAKGLFWGGISNFLQQLIGMVFGIVIARILSPDDYGLVAMLAIFTAIANIIIDSGFTIALINKKTIEHNDYNAVFWFNLFSGIGLYILLFFCAPLIAKFYHQPELINLSRLIFISFFIYGLGAAHNAIMTKKIMAKQRGIIDITAILFSGIIGVILALNGFAYWGLAFQQISQALICTILRWHFSHWKPTLNIDFSPLKRMFRYGIQMFITSVLYITSSNLFSILLGKFFGKTITGYYNQGNKWATLANSAINSTFVNSMPVFVEARDDIKRELNIFRKLNRFGAFITFPLMLGFALIGKEFTIITVGEKWIESVIFLQLFCIQGSVSFLWSNYIFLLLANGKFNIYMWGIATVLTLQSLSVLLAYYLGQSIITMIVIYIAIYMSSFLLWHHYASKIIGLKVIQTIKDISPYMATTAFAIICAWFISQNIDNLYLRFSTKISVTATIYIAIMYFSNSVIFNESIDYFKRKFNKKIHP